VSADAKSPTTDVARPTGSIEAGDPVARRAQAALRDGHLGDAETTIRSVETGEGHVRAWRLLLEGELLFARGDMSRAETKLMQAAVVALTCGTGLQQVESKHPCGTGFQPVGSCDTGLQPVDLRLAAHALDQAGCVYRRLDQPADAAAMHETAYALRERVGSFDELSQTASNLGLDADVMRQFTVAQRWHRIAVEHAQRCASTAPVENRCHTDVERLRSIVWGRLADTLSQAGELDEAIEAARQAQTYAHAHAGGTLEAFRTDLRLCRAMAQQAECLVDRLDPRAADVLADARARLCDTLEELKPFGPEAAGHTRWCIEQLDFVERLSAATGGQTVPQMPVRECGAHPSEPQRRQPDAPL